jgi:uncharacterized protein DUF6281
MSRILTAACLVAVCAGCGASQHRLSGGSGSCASRITWQGAVYYGQLFPAQLPATLTLGTGGRPTCMDSNGGEAGASSTVDVRRLAGVDPRVAVAVRGEPDVAYLAAGYFLQLPSHPLHDAVTWPARALNELIGCRLSPPLRLEGATRYGPSLSLDVSKRDGIAQRYVRADQVLLFVDGKTRVDGLERNGLPYVPAGTMVAVEAVGCLTRGGKLAKVVPRRISPA